MSLDNKTGILVPMELSAFVLNEAVCAKDLDVKIAPITQPNYAFLRLSNNLIVPDIQDYHDLTELSPASLNPRVYDLGTKQSRRNRFGVHLHWSLPKAYRAGVASTPSANQASPQNSTTDTAAPRYPTAPNRYLIVRRITSFSPPNAICLPVQAFVIESDRLARIDDFPDDADLETIAAPFIRPSADISNNPDAIEEQAELLLGKCTPFEQWMANDVVSARNSCETVSDFTLMSSSNPLFADYALHNCNVFSMIDNFACQPGSPVPYLDSATADYTVLGWYTDSTKDLFAISKTHQVHLQDCSMTLKDTSHEIDTTVTSWLGASDALQLVTHGSMYGVQYDLRSKPSTMLGHDAASKLSSDQPIAVGSSAIDAILAFCRVHGDDNATEGIPKLESDILKIQTLLRATSDDIDGHQEAFDLLATQSFLGVDGGNRWTTTNNSPAEGSDSVKLDNFRTSLETLNTIQQQLDAANKEAKVLKWRLFAEWWNYASSRNQALEASGYVTRTATLRDQLMTLIGAINADGSPIPGQDGLISQLTKAIGDNRPDGGTATSTDPAKDTVRRVAHDRYLNQNDPTILFGGLKSPWTSYLSLLPVRLATQAVSSTMQSNAWKPYRDYIGQIPSTLGLADNLANTVRNLLVEFEALHVDSQSGVPMAAVLPFFHDQNLSPDTGTRDQWKNQQPWFPLFIEWEAMYIHVDYDEWSLTPRPTRLPNTVDQIRYGIDRDFIAQPSALNDIRTVSGRNLILPQPSFSLAAVVTQIMGSTSADDLEALGLNDTEQKRLKEEVANLDFISSPLAGLTAHLQTLFQGMHVKPTVRVPGLAPVPIQAAVNATVNAFPQNWGKTLIGLIDAESAQTPYGNSVDFQQGSSISPFKPVTHGQLFFTKLNIIDRFGQAISAIKPDRWLKKKDIGTVLGHIPGINPCVGDAFAVDPSATNSNQPNTAVPEPTGNCRSITMLPSINQPSRMNATFVTPHTGGEWRPCETWENPIWGWVVVNYANYGLQFFLPDGTFYRELRLGGKAGATTGLKWLPFDPPAQLDPKVITQLDKLIQWLAADSDTARVRLHAFFDMVNQSIDEGTTHPPDAYSSVMTAAIGKPLALVTTGWSLELADDEYKNWSTLSTATPDRSLLAGNAPKTYDFAVQFGDAERWYDGMVCYWPATTHMADLAFDQMNTFFMAQTTASTSSSSSPPAAPPLPDPRIYISTPTYPHLTAYYHSPRAFLPSATVSTTAAATAYAALHTSHLRIFGMLLDPYRPVHAYSGILPIKPLQLPPWTLAKPMERMTAFFHLGPVLVTSDVPIAYDPTKPLTADYSFRAAADFVRKDERDAPLTVAIPVVGAAEWGWLQPYVTDAGTRFNMFNIDQHAGSAGKGGGSAGEMRLEKGPYTAVEGYLQLRRPVLTQ